MVSESIADVAARSRIKARVIDGADHDPKPAPLTGVCRICGRATYHNPTTPYARVHRRELGER